MSTPSRLTLEREQVYGWTMYPGYVDRPYRSPIVVREVVPLSGRRFDLTFHNLFYAAGVQIMTYRLRTLRREADYLMAEHLDDDGRTTDRVAVIERMSPRWVLDNVRSEQLLPPLFDPNGEPRVDGLDGSHRASEVPYSARDRYCGFVRRQLCWTIRNVSLQGRRLGKRTSQ